MRVHALQLALQIMGYYSGALDGNFERVPTAVKAFQRAYKLDVDGSAGSSPRACCTPGLSAGAPAPRKRKLHLHHRHLADHRQREPAQEHLHLSARLAVVPSKTSLTYIDTRVSGGVTWYQVVYNGIRGWLMGTL